MGLIHADNRSLDPKSYNPVIKADAKSVLREPAVKLARLMRFTGEVDRKVVGLLTEYCGFEASQEMSHSLNSLKGGM